MSDMEGSKLSEIIQNSLTYEKLSHRPRPLKTGLPMLDEYLEGGLTPGLIVLGAGPGQGKSTFALQLAKYVSGEEQIPVLYFSLEMSRERIAAKAITSENFQNGKALPGYPFRSGEEAKQYFFTASELFNPETLEALSEEKRQQLKEACGNALESSLYVIDRPYCAREICDCVAEFMKKQETQSREDGQPPKKPLVIVDYLQILPPDPNGRSFATDKQQVDDNLKTLRELVLKGIPVLLISSLKRGNYGKKTTSMQADSFKETGGIEYSADVMIGLQFSACNRPGGCNPDEEKKRYPREMELIILKQRYGAADVTVPLRYFAEFDYMEEKAPEEPATEPAKEAEAAAPKTVKPPEKEKKPETIQPEPKSQPENTKATVSEKPSPKEKPARETHLPRGEIAYMNNAKIANEIRNGEWQVGKEKKCNIARDKEKPVNVMFTISSSISYFDCVVADAVYSIYKANQRSFEIRDLMRAVYGDENQRLGNKGVELEQSLKRLMEATITIKCPWKAVEKWRNTGFPTGKRVEIKDNFLAATQEGSKYHFTENRPFGSMPLYYYSEKSGQMLSFPRRLLAVPAKDAKKLSNTATNIMIKRYLIRRLEILRNKPEISRTVNYYSSSMDAKGISGMLPTIGVVKKQDGNEAAWKRKLDKIHQTVKIILDGFQDCGYIEKYAEEKGGVTILGKVKDPYALDLNPKQKA